MVRTVELDASVPGFRAQDLFELVYGGGGAFLRHFHRLVNKDPDASVGEWDGDQRTVSFTTPVDAPAMIKRLIGMDVIRVVETQRRAFGPDGSATLTSEPVPDMPGGAKFSTLAVLAFSDAPGGSACQIRAVVTCTAGGPYGLTGTIESFMAEAGKKSLQDFLDAVQAYAQAPEAAAAAAVAAVPQVPTAAAVTALPVAAAVAEPPAAPAVAAAPAAAAAAAAPATAAAAAGQPEEQFYDALELPQPQLAPSGDRLLYEQTVLLYLRYLCHSGDQSIRLLQELVMQLRLLQGAVAQLEKAEEERQRRWRWLPELPETVSTRKVLLGAALLTSCSATAALMWSSWRAAPLPRRR